MSEIMTDTMVDELQDEDTLSNKYLTFNLDGQQYAIAIQNVVDIINVQPVTRVPSCPPYVRGITNLRGKVIPIIDVRVRFGKQEQDYNERTCIIVVELEGLSVGMIIDSVAEVITLEREQIATPPTFGTGYDVRFVEGIGKAESGIKLVLDCKSVLDDDNVPTIEAEEDQ